MKVTINRDALERAVSAVEPYASKQSTVPALAGVMMRATDGKLELTATDLTSAMRCEVPALVDEDGESVVSARTLAGIVKGLPQEAVDIETDGATLRVKCRRSKFRLMTLPAQEFPEFPSIDAEQSVTLPHDVLSGVVERTYRAASKDMARPILAGAHLTVADGSLTMEATDSYRLAVCETAVDADGAALDAVVPALALSKALRQMAGDVTLGTGGNQAIVSAGGVTFVTRRMEGNFPNVRQLVPQSCGTTVTVGVADLAQAVRRVGVMAGESATVRLSAQGGELLVTASSQMDGEASEAVGCDQTGADARVALNLRYLTDALAAMDGDCDLMLDGEMRPALMRWYGDGTRLTQLLMPVRW